MKDDEWQKVIDINLLQHSCYLNMQLKDDEE